MSAVVAACLVVPRQTGAGEQGRRIHNRHRPDGVAGVVRIGRVW